MKRFQAVLALVVVTVGLSSPAWAAYDFGFFRISNNSSQDIAAQLNVSVASPGAGLATFAFTNSVGIASTVAQIYVDDAAGVLSSMISVSSVQAAVSASTLGFAANGSPTDLPGGSSVTPNFAADFRASATSPAPHRGINETGEAVVLTFSLTGSNVLSDVVDAIQANTLRFGLHAISIGTDSQSDAYVSYGTTTSDSVPVIPAPAAVLLGGIGLLGVSMWRRVTSA